MVNRTKISKEIRRRTGGVSQQTGKGTAISKTKRKPEEYEGISSTYEAARRDKPKSKAKPKTEKKITKSKRTTNPFGLDPSKDKFVRIPKGEATAYVKKRVTSKPSRHGPGTHGAVRRSSDIKWGKRKELKKIKPKELQETMTADERAAAKLAEKKRKRESGEYEKLFKKGGKVKKKKKKKYSAGGRIGYQGHDGNKFVSKYYS